MDSAELERLMELVNRSNISELTLRQGSNRLTLRKPVQQQTGAGVPQHDEAAEGDETADALQLESEIQAIELVTAPLVGVFRHVKPVVGLGAQVRAGQVVGIIEALKLTNDVTAPADGKVVEVLVEDSMPVEYGQELFALRPEPS